MAGQVDLVVSIKAEVDTSELDAAMKKYDLVSRDEVGKMIASALTRYERTPVRRL